MQRRWRMRNSAPTGNALRQPPRMERFEYGIRVRENRSPSPSRIAARRQSILVPTGSPAECGPARCAILEPGHWRTKRTCIEARPGIANGAVRGWRQPGCDRVGGWNSEVVGRGDGHSIFEPLPHSAPLMRALVSPDARQVVTATLLQGVRLWDATTGLPLGEEIKLKSVPFSLEYSPDGTQLLCASNAAEVLKAATLQPAYPPLALEGVRAAHFSPDGKIIFIASADKNGRFWDAATGQPVLQPLEHNESLVAGAFSRDGERVITGTAQGSAYIWEIKTGRVLSEAFPTKRCTGGDGIQSRWHSRFDRVQGRERPDLGCDRAGLGAIVHGRG